MFDKKSELPKQKTKKKTTTKDDKKKNRDIARLLVLNENELCMIKRFKIISDKYRNRRKRFGFRLKSYSCNP